MASKTGDTAPDVPIRNAATVIVVRNPGGDPAVLMGQRGAKAAFMPNKFVFPGGAVDKADAGIDLARPFAQPCRDRADVGRDGGSPGAAALAAAAIREVWEETGLVIGQKAPWEAPPPDWESFAATGHRPDGDPLRYVFRAITPPGRPRRFDARFFALDAAHVQSDLDDFSQASDELSHLQWVPFADARRFDLPFITEVVLAEVAARLPDLGAPPSVPFFKNDDEASRFLQIHGHAGLD